MTAQDYWGRKQFYALNVQITSNETKKICNVVAKWAGKTHDARIWNSSNSKKWIEKQKDKLAAGTNKTKTKTFTTDSFALLF